MSSTITKLSTPSTFTPRGGGVAVNLSSDGKGDRIVIYGGADREGTHFNDVLVLTSGGACDEFTHNHLPESSHNPSALPAVAGSNGVALSGDEMLLFGGINFVEETVSSDLLSVKLRFDAAGAATGLTWTKHVATGEKPAGRTGHVLVSLPLHVSIAADGFTLPFMQAFILFGGSSPYSGPMNDLFLLVAVKKPEEAGERSYHFHWEALPTKGKAPAQREMHSGFVRPATASAASAGVAAYASAIQSAVRAALENSGAVTLPEGASFSAITASAPTMSKGPAGGSSEAASGPAAGFSSPTHLVVIGGRNDEGPQNDTCVLELSSLTWQDPHPLPPRQAVISSASGTDPSGCIHLCYGGYNGASGLSESLLMLDTRKGKDASEWKWTEVSLLPKPVPQPRFAAAGVVVSSSTSMEEAEGKQRGQGGMDAALVVVGGMTPDKDLSDALVMPLKLQ